jgi:hypothetical protein
MSPKPARDSYTELANLAAAIPSPVQREAALALAEIDKWRVREAQDEAAWAAVVPDD